MTTADAAVNNLPLEIGNLFAAIPANLEQELTETLDCSGPFRLERIVSRGHASAPGFWYDQAESEWVLLLQGEAALAFADGRAEVRLQAGDYLEIPAGLRHRVAWTSDTPEAVWLAVFYRGAEDLSQEGS
ncbi:cupin domain-containing protein [Motiliproteus sp. SC1-56]|uniref:cupin domain-containing protein n=1 Tax=Motiliproteus sp. SC1-56 TaxID=2799565 RepID=UPI001F5C3CDD|nr:cupin domain-containing protein [Motiliproteus sp. SC1-56]